MTPPTLAELTAKRVGQLGGETGSKTNQQQRLPDRRRQHGGQGQRGTGGRRAPDVFWTPRSTTALRKAPGLLGVKTHSGDQRSEQQIQHHRQPAPGPQTAPEQGAKTTGMDPTGPGEQR